MKRKILCFCMTFIAIFLVCLNQNVYASIACDEIPMMTNSPFNFVRGTLDINEFNQENYDKFNYFIAQYVESGYLTSDIDGKFGTNSVRFSEKATITNGVLTGIEYRFNEKIFFEGLIEDGEITIIKDEEVFLGEIYSDYSLRFQQKSYNYDGTFLEFYPDHSIDDFEVHIEGFAFNWLGTLIVLPNTYYEGHDCHIVMPYNNKLTMDEILDNVIISDFSDDYDMHVDSTDYEYETSKTGTYHLRVIANDRSNHYTFQDVIIDVVDIISPVITQNKPIILDYPADITEEDLIEYFDIEEENDYFYSIDLTDYHNELGTYSLTLEVNDEYNNESSLDFTVTIVDQKAPNIGHLLSINVNNLEYTDYDQISQLSLLSIVDNYDGDMKDKAIFNDLDDYQNNYHKPGTYRIQVEVSDTAGNSTSSIIKVNVKDADYPIIEIDKYLIVTEKGSPLTKEEVIELFKSLGYILEDEDIDGDVFNLTSLDGEYDFNYQLEDTIKDGIISTKIENSEPSIISPQVEKQIEEGMNLTLILIISISSFALITFLVLGIVLYKKKH